MTNETEAHERRDLNAIIDIIGELGAAVHNMLDDCETSGPVGKETHTITGHALAQVGCILERIDALPFEEQGYVLGTGAMLQAAIRQTVSRADLSDAKDARIAELEERYRLVVGDKINLRGRVAELEAQNKNLAMECVSSDCQAQMAYEEQVKLEADSANAEARAEAAEAKLAKARYRLHNISLNSSDAWAADEARVAIAELKGGE